ncbi:MAG TPA: hydroxyisourate hydrolase [Polyangiaceae bacterium]|jgi:5-hydroxyisourate hydrolase|nr:hydroxyisourate hydrolase [Polyangiaceae bacterium]
MTSPITTHVLDTARGAPAAKVRIALEHEGAPGRWSLAAEGVTDADGRLRTLLPEGSLRAGAYRLVFDVGEYFREQAVNAFWRQVTIEFVVHDAAAHYHVPLLVSPFGYSTYRGS